MTATEDNSLGGEGTFVGHANRASAGASLGDERTLGGGDAAGVDTAIDGLEIVDLEARYKIEGTLGQGGMGAVMLATDTRLDRKVAIKRILGEAARSKSAIARFLTEAKAIAALNHPNVVQIYDYGRAKDGPFLIMEFVEGGSLLERCVAGPIALEEAVDLACQLCDGLARAHDAGIIHRDIKPANVLLSRDAHPKLTDFGLAKADAADHGMTMTGAVMGTPDFMPPEQRRDASEVDHRSDLWSLAATVYQMVSGRSPKIIRFNDIPAALQDVLGKALEDRKDARYQSAREFRDAIRAVAHGKVSSPAAPAAVEGDLQDGQCKVCGTVNADLARKFCKKCGEALRVPCLKCDAQIPVWDTICGECGGNQAVLLENQRKDAVTQIVQTLNAVLIPKKLSSLIREAEAHAAAFDYPAAINALESIDMRLRSAGASRLLANCRDRQHVSEHLIGEIAGRVKRKEVDGLLSLVEEATALRGDRADLKKIRQQLTERRDTRLARARAAMDTGNAKEAFAALKGADKLDFGGDAPFLEQVRKAVSLEARLADAVKAAKADGVIEPDEAAAILKIGEEYLRVNPKSEQVRSLVAKCRQRLSLRNSVGIELSLIPAGTFTMGDPNGKDYESPHGVTLTKPFYLGVHPVTNAQWKRVMGSVPSEWKDADRPVTNVSWEDAVVFCRKLSALPEERKAGRVYRLPTEAEWEYACRAGTTATFSFGELEVSFCSWDGEDEDGNPVGGTEVMSNFFDYGWCSQNSETSTHTVGMKKPNPWGLYDMHGNVWEWCSDWYGWYAPGSVTDPKGPSSASGRVCRGGSWNDTAEDCRSAVRRGDDPSNRYGSLGFRLALSPSGVKPPEAGPGH